MVAAGTDNYRARSAYKLIEIQVRRNGSTAKGSSIVPDMAFNTAGLIQEFIVSKRIHMFLIKPTL